MKLIDQTTKKLPKWVIGLNFKAVYYGVKYEAECMLKSGGRLVNTASTLGLKAMPGIAHYAASKVAVNGLIRSVALEYASRTIRVNAISAGAIGRDAHAFGNCIPMRRIDREVAEAVLCLMSDKTSYAADSVLSIDGGIYAG
jgi:NAD(P)-dependent dehydrogenase (short-subunit alcohol dehydrogenase family)